MSLAEGIYFLFIGVIGFVRLLVMWLIFRFDWRVKVLVSVLFVAGFIGYFFYFQYDQVREHGERFDVLEDYLASEFPGDVFVVDPEELEPGAVVG